MTFAFFISYICAISFFSCLYFAIFFQDFVTYFYIPVMEISVILVSLVTNPLQQCLAAEHHLLYHTGLPTCVLVTMTTCIDRLIPQQLSAHVIYVDAIKLYTTRGIDILRCTKLFLAHRDLYNRVCPISKLNRQKLNKLS